MIKKTKPNLFVADQEDLCTSDTVFIRETPDSLYHICDRYRSAFGMEQYLVGAVGFDQVRGTYYCTRPQCFVSLDLEDVWADDELTGCEGQA